MADQPDKIAQGRTSGANAHALADSKWREMSAQSASVLIFAVAIVVRLMYVLAIRGIPFFDHPSVDARAFDEWGQRIAGGDWWGSSSFFLAPAYPYLLGVVYTIFGHSLLAVHLVQVAIGAGSCVLLYRAGRGFFDSRIGMVAGLMLAFYPPAIFFDGIIHKACLALFLTCGLLACLAVRSGEHRKRRALLTGVVVGLLALTRENMLFLIVLVPVFLLLCDGAIARKRRWTQVGTFALGVVLILGPVVARNYSFGGSLVLATTNMGSNFYIGNNPDADGLYQSADIARQDPVYEQADAVRRAEQAVGKKLTASEASNYWLKRGLSWIAANPTAWAKLTAWKVLLCWHRFEIPDTEDIYAYGEWCRPLGWAFRVWHFGLLAPLAIIGIVLNRHRWRELWVLVVIAGLITASIALFFVFARFRFPLVPVLILFSASAVVEVVRRNRAGSIKGLAGPVSIGAVVAIVCNVPVLDEGAYRSNAFVNLGDISRRAGATEDSQRYLRRALSLYQRNPFAHYQLGQVYAETGRTDEAIEHLRRAITIDDSASVFHVFLASVLAQTGRGREAVAHYDRALRLNPQDAETRRAYRDLLNSLGDIKAADAQAKLLNRAERGMDQVESEEGRGMTLAQRVDAARAALDLGEFGKSIDLYLRIFRGRPDDPVLHYEVAGALARAGRIDEAMGHYRASVKLKPDYAAAHSDLGQLLSNLDRVDEAIAHYRQAIEVEPSLFSAHYNLASGLAATGDLDEAIESMTRCAELAERANRADLVARVKDRLRQLKDARRE
jgi:tetratricopeptide (TPR) repeat protein